MKEILKILKKHKMVVYYLFFGVCSTIVNLVTYTISYETFKFNNITSTILAWVFSVIFAFITNKQFVFESKSWEITKLFNEVKSFFGCRVLTGILDVGIMYISVDIMLMNASLMKLISNVIVVILNYIASKLLVFKD